MYRHIYYHMYLHTYIGKKKEILLVSLSEETTGGGRGKEHVRE
jgi:hypothetical protein